jgi:hypothetical protein
MLFWAASRSGQGCQAEALFDQLQDCGQVHHGVRHVVGRWLWVRRRTVFAGRPSLGGKAELRSQRRLHDGKPKIDLRGYSGKGPRFDGRGEWPVVGGNQVEAADCRGPLGLASADRPNAPVATRASMVRRYCALRNSAASGGRVSFKENGRPWVGISSALTPPRLPMPLPAYSRASLLSISRQ